MNIESYFNNAKVSMFRFEALQVYDVGVDDMSDEEMIPWRAFVKEKVESGVLMQRVRLLTYPLTDYTIRELEIHKKSVVCGDDIRTVDSEIFNRLNIEAKDFWLIDDEVCLEMNYDESGKWLGFEMSNDIEKYIKIKEVLLRNSTPL